MGGTQAPSAGLAKSEASNKQHKQPHQASAGAAQNALPNPGLRKWKELREEWTKAPPGFKQPPPRPYEGCVDADVLLSCQPLPEPVPLEEVVEALVEAWEDADLIYY